MFDTNVFDLTVSVLPLTIPHRYWKQISSWALWSV